MTVKITDHRKYQFPDLCIKFIVLYLTHGHSLTTFISPCSFSLPITVNSPYTTFLYSKNIYKHPYEFEHKPRGWQVQLGKTFDYSLSINGVEFEQMEEAPPRERASLARSTITMQMSGPKK